jgi:S-adenosylmethionine:tRNA ribosyltransferase-isomerase
MNQWSPTCEQRTDAAAALYPYAARQPRTISDRICCPAGFGSCADGGTALYSCADAARSPERVRFATVTLHVGLDTFAPVTEDDPTEHQIHTEWCELLLETAEAIQQTRAAGRRVVAVGTTSVRTLETAARQATPGQSIAPFSGPTALISCLALSSKSLTP